MDLTVIPLSIHGVDFFPNVAVIRFYRSVVLVKYIDAHYEIDSDGSEEEFVK